MHIYPKINLKININKIKQKQLNSTKYLIVKQGLVPHWNFSSYNDFVAHMYAKDESNLVPLFPFFLWYCFRNEGHTSKKTTN